jgi:hypothetical protein
MATAQSPAAVQYALADAKADIATLARERDALAAENLRIREALYLANEKQIACIENLLRESP